LSVAAVQVNLVDVEVVPDDVKPAGAVELQYQMALSKRLNSNCIKAFVVAITSADPEPYKSVAARIPNVLASS
jgi:hypothetical protein